MAPYNRAKPECTVLRPFGETPIQSSIACLLLGGYEGLEFFLVAPNCDPKEHRSNTVESYGNTLGLYPVHLFWVLPSFHGTRMEVRGGLPELPLVSPSLRINIVLFAHGPPSIAGNALHGDELQKG